MKDRRPSFFFLWPIVLIAAAPNLQRVVFNVRLHLFPCVLQVGGPCSIDGNILGCML